jgi:hypothetical protein
MPQFFVVIFDTFVELVIRILMFVTQPFEDPGVDGRVILTL